MLSRTKASPVAFTPPLARLPKDDPFMRRTGNTSPRPVTRLLGITATYVLLQRDLMPFIGTSRTRVARNVSFSRKADTWLTSSQMLFPLGDRQKTTPVPSPSKDGTACPPPRPLRVVPCHTASFLVSLRTRRASHTTQDVVTPPGRASVWATLTFFRKFPSRLKVYSLSSFPFIALRVFSLRQ